MERKLKWSPYNNDDPEWNGTFYYIGRRLRIETDFREHYGNSYEKKAVDQLINQYIDCGNCFKTEAEAQAVLDKILPLFDHQFTGIEEATVPASIEPEEETESVEDII